MVENDDEEDDEEDDDDDATDDDDDDGAEVRAAADAEPDEVTAGAGGDLLFLADFDDRLEKTGDCSCA